MNNCHKEALNIRASNIKDDYQEEKELISLERILNRRPIILIGTTTENFVKLIKEIKYGN